MIEGLQIDAQSDIPKYRQIENAIEHGVAEGLLKKNTQLPSINKLCSAYGLSRDTVVKAYNILRERGLIDSTHGKGYYITGEFSTPKKKVFVLFNELNAYKEVLHKSLLNALGNEVEIDTFFHNHNPEVFEYLIEKALGKYTHYVIMPTFHEYEERVLRAVEKIPSQKLFILDRHLEGINGGSVYQDFLNDVLSSFRELHQSIKKYKKVFVLYDEMYLHPKQSVTGIDTYCGQHKIDLEVRSSMAKIESGVLYVTFKDADLIKLVKMGNSLKLVPGKEYGILSYNDSPIKEIIHEGISIISTDFELMGKTTAAMILEGYQAQVANPVKLIKRGSV